MAVLQTMPLVVEAVHLQLVLTELLLVVTAVTEPHQALAVLA
jgi:hypothetical protein